MERESRNFETLNSYAEVFSEEFDRYEGDVEKFFTETSDRLKESEDFKPYMDQLIELSILASEPGIENFEALSHFIAGGLMAYNTMEKVHGKEIYVQIHEALNSFYAHCKLYVNEELVERPSLISVELREKLTGVHMNYEMDNNLAFEGLPTDEMYVVTQIFDALINGPHNELYDALRGYTLVRASLIWHQTNKIERQKEESLYDDDKLTVYRDFYEIVADLKIDKNLAEGHISIQDSIDRLYNYFCVAVDQASSQVDMRVERNKEMVMDELNEVIVSYLSKHKLTELLTNTNIFVDGFNIVLIYDGQDILRHVVTLGEESRVQGVLIDIVTRDIPTEDSVGVLREALKAGGEGVETDFDQLGMVMELVDAKILDYVRGNIVPIDDSFRVFIPLGYRDSTFYKAVIEEDVEPQDDYIIEDEDDYDE